MSNEKERLLVAQWVLERNLAWIAAAEVKVGVIVTIDTAMLGSVGAAYASANATALSPWSLLFGGAAVLFAGLGIFCASMAVLPRLNGPKESLVFFGPIGRLKRNEYAEKFKQASDAQLLDDWTAQIHRNAEIANEKFSWVRTSMWYSFFSILPWAVAITMLLKKTSE